MIPPQAPIVLQIPHLSDQPASTTQTELNQHFSVRFPVLVFCGCAIVAAYILEENWPIFLK